MIDFDEREAKRLIGLQKKKCILVPIGAFRFLPALGPPEERSYVLLANDVCDDLCSLIDPARDPAEAQMWLAEKLISLAQANDPVRAIQAQVDFWKVLRVADGKLSWMDFCVFVAVQSVIGRRRYSSITRDMISARASGYASEKCFVPGARVFSVDQVKRSVRRLQARGMLQFYQISRRSVIYCSWRVKAEAFTEMMADLRLKRDARSTFDLSVERRYQQKKAEPVGTSSSQCASQSPEDNATRSGKAANGVPGKNSKPQIPEGFRPRATWASLCGQGFISTVVEWETRIIDGKEVCRPLRFLNAN